MKWVRQFEGPFLVVSKPTSLTARIQHSPKAQIKVVHIDKLKHFNGTPPKAWKLPVEAGSNGDTSHLVVGGTNIAERGDVASSPAVVQGSNTGPNVVDGLFQSQTVEGSSPEFVSINGQSAVRDANENVGVATPTIVRSGDSSRGRNNLVQPMGMARFDRGENEKFSASMDARKFGGDLLSPGGANGSIVVGRELLADSLAATEGNSSSRFGTSQCEVARNGISTDGLAAIEGTRPSCFRSDSSFSQVCSTPMGTPTGCERPFEVRDAGDIHGKNVVDCVKDRFASGRVPHETGAVSPSVMAENHGMEARFDSHSETGAA